MSLACTKLIGEYSWEGRKEAGVGRGRTGLLHSVMETSADAAENSGARITLQCCTELG